MFLLNSKTLVLWTIINCIVGITIARGSKKRDDIDYEINNSAEYDDYPANKDVHRPQETNGVKIFHLTNGRALSKTGKNTIQYPDEKIDFEDPAWFDNYFDKWPCGQAHRNKLRISNGRDSHAGEFPSFMELHTETTMGFGLCGATLIAPQLLVTAAHCFMSDEEFHVTVSPQNSEAKINVSVKYKADRVCASSKFRGTIEDGFDLAVLHLERPVEFNNYTGLACLPSRKHDPKEKVNVVGVGYTDWSSRPATKLQVLPLMQAECNVEGRHFTKICFKSARKGNLGDSCEGDSGGPLYRKDERGQTVLAVVSYGPLGCKSTEKQVSINTDLFMSLLDLKDLVRACLEPAKK